MIVMISAHKAEHTALENAKANKQLATSLEILGVNFQHSEGVWNNDIEPSFVVRDVNDRLVKQLVKLADQHKQDAILIVREDEVKVSLDKPKQPYTYDAFNRVYLTTDIEPMDLYI